MNMKFFVIPAILFSFFHLNQAGPLRLQKRAAFYIANETACVVDNTVYSSGDPIPTDDPCEACRCRPPGFACVLKECESKPGCRAVRRVGKCCPEYICGCEHNGRMYRDGDEIRDSQNPCYTCHCQGSSIACAFVDCFFRVDCAPEYVPGECCPLYKHCATLDSDNSTNVDYAFSTEKAYGNEETTVNPKVSESILYPEIPENTPNLEVKTENKKDSSEISPPESLDTSILFSVNGGAESSKDIQTTQKGTSTESISESSSEETGLDAESSEENSSEKQIENVTELLKTDYEIMKDEVKPKEPEITSEQGPSEISVGSEISAENDKNVEIFPAEESTTEELKFKTALPAETTEQTVSSTTVLPDSFEDTDDKANELIKRFRSLKNLTSVDVTESPKENTEVKSDAAAEAGTKETAEKVVTPADAKRPTTVKLEKEIIVEDAKDIKSSEVTTEAFSKSETPHYNINTKVTSESVENNTTDVEVKEPTSSEKVYVETPSPSVSNEPEQIVFKALSDAAEANNKQEIAVITNEVTTSQTTVGISVTTTTKAKDVSTKSSLAPETDKVQLHTDNSKIALSTEIPKIAEVESITTVVTEVSSEKVESSKE